MRVLLSTYGSCGGVEPLVGLAERLRALGAEVGYARRRTSRIGWLVPACR
jgi:UDP:flavonoid glycosyltransferase YjiC (YdhE family)